MRRKIINREDVELLVNEFYLLVQKDEKIGPIFNNRIKDKWPEHLSKMYNFWATVLLEERTYSGAPFLPHAKMDLSQEHFDRWIMLFHQTIDLHFEGSIAEEAKERADKMALMFISKINYLREHKNFRPLN